MRWGIVATIKAPVSEILKFVAHHLELGVDRIFLFLDDNNPDAIAALRGHPKVTLTRTDRDYWQNLNGKRPAKHQVRQSANATNAYTMANDIDWLLHIDVDEFLWPDRPVTDILRDLSADTLVARVHPSEALASEDVANDMTDTPDGTTYFKAWMPANGKRIELAQQIYPTFGLYVKGGFLSHIAGKIFVRTGQNHMSMRIHNAFQGDIENPNSVILGDIDLCHLHVNTWEAWLRTYRYRLEKGSYRSEMRPAVSANKGGLSLHQLFHMLEEEDGKTGLRAFFDEVCVATPVLRAKLSKHGLLKQRCLDLDAKLSRQFPKF